MHSSPSLSQRLTSLSAIKLIDSSTSYEYDARSQTYLQHDFARQVLARLLAVEGKKLEKIPVSERAVSGHPSVSVRSGDTLVSFISNGLGERSPAMEYLEIVLASLSEQKM
jgi:small subunit ribosomal protein S29